MRRTPIACCLCQGGNYEAWSPSYASGPSIRFYEDGMVEDDFLDGPRTSITQAEVKDIKDYIRFPHVRKRRQIGV